MFVLIGAPVYARDWILPHYFNAIEKQDFPLENIGFIFEAGPNDDTTLDCLYDWHSRHPQVKCFDVNVNTLTAHQDHTDGRRQWTKERYKNMAVFRNNLLDRAIARQPDRYFSLDTDIILEDPTTITSLVAATQMLDAVSPLLYMTPEGTEFPCVMSWVDHVGGRARRMLHKYDIGKVFRADIIMAAKMMSKEVYSNVRYSWHPQGEDLGWSANAAALGYKLFCASDIYCPHIMNKGALAEYQEKGDYRGFLKTYDC